MRLTRRGYMLVGLTLGAMTMLGGTLEAPENTPVQHEVPTLTIFEDGSGVRLEPDGSETIFPSDSFCWTDPDTGNIYSCPSTPE